MRCVSGNTVELPAVIMLPWALTGSASGRATLPSVVAPPAVAPVGSAAIAVGAGAAVGAAAGPDVGALVVPAPPQAARIGMTSARSSKKAARLLTAEIIIDSSSI